MTKTLLLAFLMAAGLCACQQAVPNGQGEQGGQGGAVMPAQATTKVTAAQSWEPLNPQTQLGEEQPPQPYDTIGEVHTEYVYLDSARGRLILQNSFPRGGGSIDGGSGRGYLGPYATFYSFGIFWTRVINTTTAPLTLALDFPADSLPASTVPGSHFRLFLPPDTMRADKLTLFNYGLSGMRPFLDEHFHKASHMQVTVGPNQDAYFYAALLLHMPEGNGSIRAGLSIEDNQLTYRINLGPADTTTFPCGQITRK